MDAGAVFNDLLAEYEQAKQRKSAIWPIIFGKFHAIGQGKSSTNPTDQELDEFDAACDQVRDLERKMRELCDSVGK